MYFSNNNNFFHGIMFHHFHDNNLHKKSQGSINQDEFYNLIKFIGRENILDAEEFFIRLKEKKLTEKNLCLTFDDGIRCQYDVALPVLESLKIKSFFFASSSFFKGRPNLIELYRYFRTNYFLNLDEFYNLFYNIMNKNLEKFLQKEKELLNNIKLKFPVYTTNDVKFRVVRNKLVTQEEYRAIMFNMFKEKNFKPEDYHEVLCMKNKHLIKIKELGHLIGLHSHSHPGFLEKLSFEEQTNEYNKNIAFLSETLNCEKKEIKYMAHPSGSYNQDTLKILKNLGIELGFKQIMTIEPERNMKKINNSFLEVARQDHSIIMKMIN